MGETAELRNEQAGTFGFNDFITQGDNEATIRKLLRTMVPTVDMRDFQRRWKFSSGNQALLDTEVVAVRWIVPTGEAWKVQGIFWENADDAEHQYSVSFTVNPSLQGDGGLAVSIYRAALLNIASGQSKVIYGLNIQTRTNTDLYHQFLDLTLEPADAVTVTMLTGSNGVSSARWTLLYEIVPAPAVARTRGVAGLRVIT